jgi:alpha/beta superfamily hydrolase
MRKLIVFCLFVTNLAVAQVERVTIPNDHGGTLAGKFLDAGKNAPAVFFFPMCDKNAQDGWLPVAEHLQKSGVSSLIVHHRGYGDSTSATSPAEDQRTADADAGIAYLKSRVRKDTPIAVAGSSCGVYLAIMTAARNKDTARAVVALTGPHGKNQLQYIKETPSLPVFSGAGKADLPAVEMAQARQAASGNPSSTIVLAEHNAHGTDLFALNAELPGQIAEWLVAQLKPQPAK